jgi:uncharacterized membrane protein YjjP (DUF1212 family)
VPPATLTAAPTGLTDVSELATRRPFGQTVRPGAYPSSGWVDDDQLPADPFGPDAQLSLQQWLSDDDLAPIQPTEAQARRAQALADGQLGEVLPPQAEALPVLTTETIERDRLQRQSPAQTVPITTTSRRRTSAESTGPVSRPDTSMLPAVGPSDLGSQPSTQMQAAAYPSSSSTTTTGPLPRRSRRMLESIMKRDAAMTAAMPMVERLTASPFAGLRRFASSDDREARRTLNFALRLAETMVHYGADALDVENAVVAVCATYGVENIEVDITNQSVTINYVADLSGFDASATREDVFNHADTTSHTVMRVVRSSSDNYSGLADTHRLVTEISRGEMSREEARERLEAINSRPKPFPNWVVSLATMAAAFAITLGIGGGVTGATISTLSAAMVGRIGAVMGRRRVPEFFTMVVSAFVITVMALLGSQVGIEMSPPKVIAAGLIMLMPTTRFMSTMHDAISGFPVTAAGRALSTGMAFAGIVAGIYTGIAIMGLLGQGGLDISQTQFEPAPTYVNIICMTLAAGLIAISLQASARHLLPAMIAGLGGLLAYHLVGWVGLDSRLQVVCGATMTGVIGAFVAGRHRIPSLVLAVPGMTFLLPGLSVFRGMYAVTIEAETTGHGIVSLVTAMTTILSMAAGLVLGQLLMRPFVRSEDARIGMRRNRRR